MDRRWNKILSLCCPLSAVLGEDIIIIIIIIMQRFFKDDVSQVRGSRGGHVDLQTYDCCVSQ